MKTTIKAMNFEEAWQAIVWRHKLYHTKLKHFGYMPTSFGFPFISEMFNKEELTSQDLAKYKKLFQQNGYKESDLHKYDDLLKNDVIPRFEKIVQEKIVPLLPNWNALMPDRLNIVCGYGGGGSYSAVKNGIARITFRMTQFRNAPDAMLKTLLHEFVHILIETQIIQKYNVPQDLKERIVDIIGLELFNKECQKKFENSFANAYINQNVIRTSLPSAVEKMMSDYNKIKQQEKYR